MKTCMLLATLALTTPSVPAGAADLLASIDSSVDASCGSSWALAHIQHRFAYAERTQWHRGFVIGEIGNPRPSGHPYAQVGLVKRDFCVADAIMTDGNAHPVYYAIEHGLGFAGIGSNVDFCTLGLDPWHIHDGDCRTVR